MPPTIFASGNENMLCPYVVGQSGTDRPESVLVTMPPAATSKSVAHTSRRAYRWSQVTTRSILLLSGGFERERRGRGLLLADGHFLIEPAELLVPGLEG